MSRRVKVSNLIGPASLAGARPRVGPTPFSWAQAQLSEGTADTIDLEASGCRRGCPGRLSPSESAQHRSSSSLPQAWWDAAPARKAVAPNPFRANPCRCGSGPNEQVGLLLGVPTPFQPQVPKPRRCASAPPRLIDIINNYRYLSSCIDHVDIYARVDIYR